MEDKPEFIAAWRLPPTPGRDRCHAPANANEIDSIPAGSDLAGSSKRQPTGGKAAIIALFRAVKALLCKKDEDKPQPQARRRRGETDKGLVAACRKMPHRLTPTAPAARGRYAALQPAPKVREAIAPTSAYASAALYLSDTLDWLNLWQDNADNDHWYEEDFSAKQDQNFPQP